MSSLKRALERSKAAWEAVGKPERARAVRGEEPHVCVGYDGTYMLHVDHATATDWRAMVPKEAKDAGWPRYYTTGGDALVMRSAQMRDGAYYYPSQVAEPCNGWWGSSGPEQNGFTPVTAHQFAEWLYDHGHTEAAYKIEPMWEPESTAYRGDWFAGVGDDKPTKVLAMVKSARVLRRSRARRDAIAEIEGKLKALGEIR